ncbi:DUF2829 domain-containing protein [Geoalkalibacter sp.]|mgnify:CR=1 FL=1|uniref:DUF2829 domain-containing protein n=1 Tax=Geoalkalibacter sp. TaxID=3041440 RepID=UPI00272E206E|nr:DUF2829 domain-containing protein [Geoalkalibacter sp.]
MNFGQAIEAMKAGNKVAREGWNGKNMFIFLREGRVIENASGPMVDGSGSTTFESCPHFCMRDAQGKCVVGWLASQTDMLADDWSIV